MDKQPQDGESIIQIDPAYEGHYAMGMRNYVQKCSFDEVVKYYDDGNLGKPDFWWISAKDFPFPDQPKRSKREDVSVIKGSNECIAFDAIPSKECREYHENSYVQINGQLRRCGALNTMET